MPIDDEFGNGHDVENRRRRRRVDFDDDYFSHEPDSFHDGQQHLMERDGTPLMEGNETPYYKSVIDEPPVRRYLRDRAFGTGASDADKGADKPDEEPHRYRRGCYQC